MSSEDDGIPNEEEVIREEDILEIIEADGTAAQAEDDEDDDAMETSGEEPSDSGPDLSAFTFKGHSQNVFAVDVNKDGKMACSGGEDDKAFLWETDTGKVILDCEGHKDSVTWAKFNSKSTLLATGDMSGLIKIWDLSSLALLTEMELGADLEWLLWHPTLDVILCGTNDGLVWMRLVHSDKFKVFPGLGGSCTAGAFISNGNKLLAGYEIGLCAVWDLKAEKSTKITGITPWESPKAVTSAAIAVDDPIGAVGYENGFIFIVNTDSCKVLSSLEAPKKEDDESIETLAFGHSSSVLAAGTVSGALLIWDIGTLILKHNCPHSDGVVKVVWLNETIVLSGSLDGRVRLWDSRDGRLGFEWSGHSGAILDCATDSQNVILTASADNTCKVFRIEQ